MSTYNATPLLQKIPKNNILPNLFLQKHVSTNTVIHTATKREYSAHAFGPDLCRSASARGYAVFMLYPVGGKVLPLRLYLVDINLYILDFVIYGSIGIVLRNWVLKGFQKNFFRVRER